MRKLLLPLLAGKSAYSIGLWGDLPYSDLQKTSGVPNLIADMNDQKLAFSVHDGDIKSGSSKCTNDHYTQAETYFNSLRAPAMYTPGDNEWTDCDRAGDSSLERLKYIRSTMFDTQTSFGQRKIRLQGPAGALRREPPLVERRRAVRHAARRRLGQQLLRRRGARSR